MLKIWLHRHLKQIGIACIIGAAILLYLAISFERRPEILNVSDAGVFWQSGRGFKWGLVALCVVFFGVGGEALYLYAKNRKEKDTKKLDSIVDKMIRRR